MMISPEFFIEQYKDKRYEELLPVRDNLLEEIRAFENRTYDPELDSWRPSPDVIYQFNLEYLGKLCELIAEKYRQECDEEEYDEEDDEDEDEAE